MATVIAMPLAGAGAFDPLAGVVVGAGCIVATVI